MEMAEKEGRVVRKQTPIPLKCQVTEHTAVKWGHSLFSSGLRVLFLNVFPDKKSFKMYLLVLK